MSRIPRCDICGVRDAEYVCKGCGRLVCRIHFSLPSSLCSECLTSGYGGGVRGVEVPMAEALKPLVAMLVGTLLIVTGFVLVSLSLAGGHPIPINATATDTTTVIIFPFPIVIKGAVGLVLGLSIAALFIAVFLWLIFKYFLR